jgi:hypothetical protein
MSKPLPKQRKPRLTCQVERLNPKLFAKETFITVTEPRWFNYGLPPRRKHTYIIRRIRTRRLGQLELAL